jgi:hypothetical protein
MDTSIIIVSYNTAPLLLACLNSLQAAKVRTKEIFVVDNASRDESATLVKDKFSEVNLIVNKENRGFGAANNQALNLCKGKYILFLNPDTTIAEDALQKAVLYMDTHPQVGLAGAKILNPDGTSQPSVSFRYPGEKFASREIAGLAGNIACVMGAFMIAPKSLICDLQGFDEDFFLYGEDQDICWRIREKGLSIGYIEDARVFHLGGQSEVETPPVEVFTKKLKAEYLFYRKHYLPETVKKIKKEQTIKARYRLATLQLMSFFARNKFKLQNKIDCYKISLQMAKLRD